MSEIEYTEHGWRRATDALRHHRERVWDYKGRAVYHITLAVEGRFPLFGELVGETPEVARIELTEMGRYVRDTLRGLPAFYAPKGIKIRVLAVQVMPDHLHAVIHVQEQMPKSIGEVVRSFKSACTSCYKRRWGGAAEGSGGSTSLKNERGVDSNARLMGCAQAGLMGAGGAGGAGSAAAPTGVQRMVQFCRIFASRGSIWEYMPAGYHEKVLHCEGQLDRMMRYVKDNPRRLWLKRHNPELFRLRNDVVYTCPGSVQGAGTAMAAAGGAVASGVGGAVVGGAGNVCAGRAASTAGAVAGGSVCQWRFRAMGNMFLLDFALKQYLQCSRRATPDDIERLRAATLERAANGYVTVTAAISEGEKAIARAVREAGFPLVILLKDGFPQVGSAHERYYKPGGVYFDACAAGRLLLLEPYPEVMDDAGLVASVERKAPGVPKGRLRYHFLGLNYVAWMVGR